MASLFKMTSKLLCQALVRSIYDAYEVINQMDDRCKNEFHTTVMTVAKCVSSLEEYFSEVLNKSMKSLGTDDDTLIHVVVTHAEIDLANIKVSFSRRYKKPLSAMVHSDTTNNYTQFLLALIGVP
ncbi:hypothetical protein GOP47_0000386 [Adiantum capillus-veneris]|uniref:Uncharacterized protein n=1 Tax=Adiantum capillus-veneris TaxID=13818 RepID=A0A9D4ZSU8_ADICA|nr:hypothetical protein GOP47_0000386 [Adiantum capillus-veneris]